MPKQSMHEIDDKIDFKNCKKTFKLNLIILENS